MDPLYIAFGFGVGILVGMTGMGGAAVMTPLLILFGAVPAVTAVGSDIFAQAVTKTVGGWRHFRLKSVNVRLVLWLALGSIPGSITGVELIGVIQSRYGDAVNDVILIVLGGTLVVVGLTVVAKAIRGPLSHRYDTDSEPAPFHPTGRQRGLTVGLGFVTGLLIGLTSVGSGILIALILITLYRLAPRMVVGTDVFHAAILLWAAGSVHWLAGNVDFLIVLPLLIGGIPGIVIGSNLSAKVSAHGLRSMLGIIMLTSAIGVLTKAGLPIPEATIVIFPLVLGTAMVVTNRLHRRRAARTGRPMSVGGPEPGPVPLD